MRGVAAVGLCAALLVATSSACGEHSGRRLTEAQLARLVLQPNDLPSGFAQFDEGRQTLIDAHAGPRKDPQRFGRQDGWKARYRDPDPKRPTIVESRADVFATANGAKKDLNGYGEELSSWRAVLVPRIADDARGWTLLQGAPKSGYRVYTIAWRDGRITASVTLSGFDRSTVLAEAVRLARKQEAHVAAAR